MSEASDIEFDWDNGNTRHVTQDHPDRANTIADVESLFTDPFFRPLPDRIDRFGEQQYSGVAVGTEGIEKHVVFVIRKGKIRPVTCRRATRKQREAYHEIVTNQNSSQQAEGD